MERKKFLKSLPVLGLGGGMLLAGCNTTSSTDIGSGENELEGDAQLVFQAAERDAIAVQTYNFAAGSGLLSQAVLDTATVYVGHHMGHLDAFNSYLSESGEQTVNLDDYSYDERVEANGGPKSEADIIRLAMTLEFEAAEAYFSQMVSQLEQQNTRKLFGNVYPIELAHFVTLKSALNPDSSDKGINAPLFEGLTA
jgi:hypothetical protein